MDLNQVRDAVVTILGYRARRDVAEQKVRDIYDRQYAAWEKALGGSAEKLEEALKRHSAALRTVSRVFRKLERYPSSEVYRTRYFKAVKRSEETYREILEVVGVPARALPGFDKLAGVHDKACAKFNREFPDIESALR